MGVTRTKNRRRWKKEKEVEVEEKETYPDQRVLYNPDTLIGELFYTLEDIGKALASGKWIKHPGMGLEDWLKKCEEEGEDDEEEDHINYAEKIRFRDANKPRNLSADKRYVSQMNVGELIIRGKELGLNFGTKDDCPTKMKMKRQIRKAESKK